MILTILVIIFAEEPGLRWRSLELCFLTSFTLCITSIIYQSRGLLSMRHAYSSESISLALGLLGMLGIVRLDVLDEMDGWSGAFGIFLIWLIFQATNFGLLLKKTWKGQERICNTAEVPHSYWGLAAIGVSCLLCYPIAGGLRILSTGAWKRSLFFFFAFFINAVVSVELIIRTSVGPDPDFVSKLSDWGFGQVFTMFIVLGQVLDIGRYLTSPSSQDPQLSRFMVSLTLLRRYLNDWSYGFAVDFDCCGLATCCDMEIPCPVPKISKLMVGCTCRRHNIRNAERFLKLVDCCCCWFWYWEDVSIETERELNTAPSQQANEVASTEPPVQQRMEKPNDND